MKLLPYFDTAVQRNLRWHAVATLSIEQKGSKRSDETAQTRSRNSRVIFFFSNCRSSVLSSKRSRDAISSRLFSNETFGELVVNKRNIFEDVYSPRSSTSPQLKLIKRVHPSSCNSCSIFSIRDIDDKSYERVHVTIRWIGFNSNEDCLRTNTVYISNPYAVCGCTKSDYTRGSKYWLLKATERLYTRHTVWPFHQFYICSLHLEGRRRKPTAACS